MALHEVNMGINKALALATASLIFMAGCSAPQTIKDATEQTLIAIDEPSSTYGYAWVVYTNNYVEEFDVGYLAHYVNADDHQDGHGEQRRRCNTERVLRRSPKRFPSLRV